ncbi:hypothetical protein PHLCEN_2v10475 [Hermanssonia centrifuga]|uniref:Uncharacterized protein n=1 Tax=Hermanssonia centrifuga TaxID=98765 RepID=A0A2R6NNC9_9APHY|nr:hypothetical protein PHLCEN_2v10475 [Hermanssonia centrifuga]
MGIQTMYTWLSPTGQAQHIKKILDETRVFMTQLKEQVPSGMVGDSNNGTTIELLEKRLFFCEAQYKLLLEEISKGGWAELYGILVELRELLDLCCRVRTDVLKTTNTVYKENKLMDQRQAVVEAQTRAQISEWMRIREEIQMTPGKSKHFPSVSSLFTRKWKCLPRRSYTEARETASCSWSEAESQLKR